MIEVEALMMLAANAFVFQARKALARFPGLDMNARPDQYTLAVSDLMFRGLRSDSRNSTDNE